MFNLYQILLIISFFGITGNVMIFSTFPKLTKIKQRKSISLLALFELMTVLYNTSYVFLMSIGKDFYHFSKYHCKILVWLSYVLPSLSVWCLVHISIERVLQMYQIQVQKTFEYMRLITFSTIIIVYSMSFYTMGLFETKIDSKMTLVCDHYNILYELVLNSLYFLIIFATPFIIMIICSIVIIKQIYEVRKKSVVQLYHLKRRSKKHIMFSLKILLLNFNFLALNLPFCIVFFFYNQVNLIYKLTYMLLYLQFNINIFIYLAVYKDFRLKISHLIGFS